MTGNPGLQTLNTQLFSSNRSRFLVLTKATHLQAGWSEVCPSRQLLSASSNDKLSSLSKKKKSLRHHTRVKSLHVTSSKLLVAEILKMKTK